MSRQRIPRKTGGIKDPTTGRFRPVSEDERQLIAAKRLLALKRGQEHLINFTQVTMPHPDDVKDLERSQYVVAPHHELIAEKLEAVERGELLRLIVMIQPRAGKSELVSRRFPAWFLGRDSYREVIFATYNDTFAEDFGRDVRNIMQSDRYRIMFPDSGLQTGSASASRLRTLANGGAVFVGKGGSITGRGANLLLVDDPIKDAQEADSPANREKAWEWFTRVAMTRLKTLDSAVVIVATRWHEDDIIGRLIDPENPCYDPVEAKHWTTIRLASEAEKDDPLGREEGEILWPEKFPADFLNAQKRLNPRAYSALYQQRPTPEEGDYFLRDWIVSYEPKDVPDNLRIYAASDHAVGTDKYKHDASVLLVAGVDTAGQIWILDTWWHRQDTATVVEAMLGLMVKWKPITWWAEKGHISKSIGPFLRKRQLEEGVHTHVSEVTPTQNKEQRAQAIRGRMAMKMVKFPRRASWFQEAMYEMLRFPNGANDDFVDALAYIGLGLPRLVGKKIKKAPEVPKPGTMAWFKWNAKMDAKRHRFGQVADGF